MCVGGRVGPGESGGGGGGGVFVLVQEQVGSAKELMLLQ